MAKHQHARLIGEPPSRPAEQIFEELLRAAREFYSANSDSPDREELRRVLDALVEEYRAVTNERVIY
jgi:hypothetical protein